VEEIQCLVERKDKYIIEFDESVCNKEWMKKFRRYFYDFYTLEQHAQHIAQFRARFGSRHIEGYGVPLENGEVPYWADKDEVNRAINIRIISEDSDIYVDSNKRQE